MRTLYASTKRSAAKACALQKDIAINGGVASSLAVVGFPDVERVEQIAEHFIRSAPRGLGYA
jgi:hypothetical protein